MSSFTTAVVSSSNPRQSRAQSVPSGPRAGTSGGSRAAGIRYGDDFRSTRRGERVAGLWTPGLLQRLQEPLTRYHE